MSHEIRTPLAVSERVSYTGVTLLMYLQGISGLTSLLGDTPLNPEQSEHLEGIKLSVNILLTIVNDVLDFSKVESGRMDIETIRFKPYDTINELAKLLRCSTSSKPFRFECSNELPPSLEVLGDPGRIRQVLSNLLTNSFKFTQCGYVRITASLKHVDEAAASVQFVIEDTGIGMDEHVLENLFQPFRQGDVSTARLYGGTGLGLTICKQACLFLAWSSNLLTVVRSFSPLCRDKSKLSQLCPLEPKLQSPYLCKSLARPATATCPLLLLSQLIRWIMCPVLCGNQCRCRQPKDSILTSC